MGIADLHIHTTHSWDGTATVAAVLKHVVSHTDLDLIAITDHDEISGALQALELAPAYGLAVVPGSEISTAEGHLLALFIERKIPAGLSLHESIVRVGELGGLCIAPHVAARRANGLSTAAVRAALQDRDIRRILVGIEVYNAGVIPGSSNRIAQALADQLPVAQVASSDAHLLWMIGRGATGFHGGTPTDLRRALETAATSAIAGRAACSPPRVISQWLSHYLLRRAGWVRGNEGPQAPIRLRRVKHMTPQERQARPRPPAAH